MKTSKLIILTLLSTLIISCGSKKKDENQTNFQDLQKRLEQQRQQQQLNQNNNGSQNTSVRTGGKQENGPVTETVNELYFALRSSRLDMAALNQGQTVYIQCQSMKTINEINLCRVGYSKREIDLGASYIGKGHSEDIYNSLQSEALAQSMINGEPLAINCKEQCQISHNLQIK